MTKMEGTEEGIWNRIQTPVKSPNRTRQTIKPQPNVRKSKDIKWAPALDLILEDI